ncbi:thiol reductase thioredoxin [Kozakia baliensis]|nr:thiol reductase thioredoxin [Kozakia baliensis]
MKGFFQVKFSYFLAGAFALSLSTASLAQATDHVPPPHLDPATQIAPAKDVYPDVSLASKQVQEAFATAAASHRKVLLDFGGNWCPDCRMLAGVFNQPEVAQWLESQFVIVPVNVGRINQNLDLAQRYGVTIHEVPTVLIITAGGKLLNADGTHTLGNARAMSAQAVLDLLDQWNQRG